MEGCQWVSLSADKLEKIWVLLGKKPHIFFHDTKLKLNITYLEQLFYAFMDFLILKNILSHSQYESISCVKNPTSFVARIL